MTVEKNRKKRIILVILAIVMVCCLIIIGTLAWLRYRTDEAINTFTLGEGVKINLEEKKYDTEENKKRREEFTPGMMLDKDPTVYIQDVEMDEYIAVVVRYYIEEVDYDTKEITLKEVNYNKFKEYATIYSFQKVKGGGVVTGSVISSEEEKLYDLGDGIRNGWVHDPDYRIFYYGSAKGTSNNTAVTIDDAIDDVVFTSVTSGAAITLFDKVKVSKAYDRYNKDFNEEKYRYKITEKFTMEDRIVVEDTTKTKTIEVNKTKGQLKGFHINICAFAVQGNVSSAEGKKALNGLIEEHIGVSTPE